MLAAQVVEDIQVTTLGAELERMHHAVALKAGNFRPNLQGSLVQSVLQLFRKSSACKFKPEEEAKIQAAIEAAVREDRPIPIGLLWACSGIAPSSHKFLQPTLNMPRLGDLWFFFWFDMLNHKIRQIYGPGIELLVLDEEPQLHVLGLDPKATLKRRQIIEGVASQFASFVRIEVLPDLRGQYAVEVPEQQPHMVYSLVTSRDWDGRLPSEVYNLQYCKSTISWEEVRAMVPKDIWAEATRMRIELEAIGLARKRANYMADRFGGRPIIDASITRRGRWTPNIWSFTFPQHGGTLLDANNNGRFSVSILPESRLIGEYTPVYLDPTEFSPHAYINGEGGQLFPFYWAKRPEAILTP